MAGLDPEKPMFPISVVAEQLQVHQRTLRIYDDEEILSPKRSPKNRRLYSFNDIERGKFIQFLTRELGINLAGVKIILVFCEVTRDTNGLSDREWLEDCARKAKISLEKQEENKTKLSRRGRKPSK